MVQVVDLVKWSIIGLVDGLLPVLCQAITYTNTDWPVVSESIRTNLIEVLIKTFWKKIHVLKLLGVLFRLQSDCHMVSGVLLNVGSGNRLVA